MFQSQVNNVHWAWTMFTEPEANNSISIIFRAEYQELQNSELKQKKPRRNCSWAWTYAAVVLMISLRVHRLWINLLIELDSKTSERNTTKIKFNQYLCFIVVVFIHSCHHRLKMSSFSLKKNKFQLIDLTCWRSTQPLRLRFSTALNTSSWKDFRSKGDSSHFKNSTSFQISWTWRGVFRINENFIQKLSVMFTWRDGKDCALSNQALTGWISCHMTSFPTSR